MRERRKKARRPGTPTLEQLEAELNREQRKHSVRKGIRNTITVLLVAAAAAVLLVMLFMPVLQINGNSMAGTLSDGETVVVLKGSEPEAGDIIAFYREDELLVKRVIALAGQTVDIDEEGDVYVDGELLDEPYVETKTKGKCSIELPYTVPDGQIFVLGDNRADSIDSRSSGMGCIKESKVAGIVWLRVRPARRFGLVR